MFFYQIRLLTTTILFHFFIHTTKMYERYRIPLYPYLFYVPVAIVVILTLMNVDVVDNTEFIQNGIWYSPIFNEILLYETDPFNCNNCSYDSHFMEWDEPRDFVQKT